MARQKEQADFFIDGQNLFLGAKSIFGYQHPNFDVLKLCHGLSNSRGWSVGTIHFYTGMPSPLENVNWHDYWSRRLADLGKNGVKIFNPPLRYRNGFETFPDGSRRMVTTATEKGVDVRIAIDIFKSALKGTDKIVILSQDNDLSVAATEVRAVSVSMDRKIEVFSVFPVSDIRHGRGIEGTTWVPMDKSIYDFYLDRRDFRTPGMRQSHLEKERRFAAMQDPRIMGGRQRFDHESRGHRPQSDPPLMDGMPSHPFLDKDDNRRLNRACAAAQIVPGSELQQSHDYLGNKKP